MTLSRPVVTVVVALLMLLALNSAVGFEYRSVDVGSSLRPTVSLSAARKLLHHQIGRTAVIHRPAILGPGSESGGAATERIGGEGCAMEDIVVYQGQTEPLESGIPTYTVEVHNLCTGGCSAMAEIHLDCGRFSSARLINPRVFRRIALGDCLLNDGRPLRAGASLSFQYADTFMYPLSVSSVVCKP